MPGAKDLTLPWPPFPENYLFSNYDGDDSSTATGKRIFQPYWTKHVDALPMDQISFQATPSVNSISEEDRLKPIPVAGNAVIPDDLTLYPKMSARGAEGLLITQKLVPWSINGSTSQAGNETVGGDVGADTAVGASTSTASVEPMVVRRRHARGLLGAKL